MIRIIYREIFIVDTHTYLSTLWGDDERSLSSRSRDDECMLTIIREDSTKPVDIIDDLPIECDNLISCEYSCTLCDTPREW